MFVDDTLANVVAARSLGIVALHFTGVGALERALAELTREPELVAPLV